MKQNLLNNWRKVAVSASTSLFLIVVSVVSILLTNDVKVSNSEVLGVTTSAWNDISVGGNVVPLMGKDGTGAIVMFQNTTREYYRFNDGTKEFDLVDTAVSGIQDYRRTAFRLHPNFHSLVANRVRPEENYFPANLVSCPNGDVFIVGRSYGYRWSDGTGSFLTYSNIPENYMAYVRVASDEITSFSLYSEGNSILTPDDVIPYYDMAIVPYYTTVSVCTPDNTVLTIEGAQVEDYRVLSEDPLVDTLEAPEYLMFNEITSLGTYLSRNIVRTSLGVNVISGPSALFYYEDELHVMRSDGIFITDFIGSMSLAYEYPVIDAVHYAQVVNNLGNIVLISSTDSFTRVHEYVDSNWSQQGSDLPPAEGAQIITYGDGYLAILDRGSFASIYHYDTDNGNWGQVGDDIVVEGFTGGDLLQDVLIQHSGNDIVVSFVEGEVSTAYNPPRFARVYYLSYSGGGLTPTPSTTVTVTPTPTVTVTTPTPTVTVTTPTPTVTVTTPTPTVTVTTPTPTVTVTTPTPTVTVTTPTPSVSVVVPTLTTYPPYVTPTNEDDGDDIDETPNLPFLGNVTPSVDYNDSDVDNGAGFLSGELIGMQVFAQIVLVGAVALDFMGPLLAAALSTNKKREGFAGIVYDSVAKTPVARAVVRVFGEDEKLLQTLVTDIHGVFQLNKLEGGVRLKVQHARYTFPTILISSPNDGEYQKIYKGEKLQVKPGEPVVCSVPIDPVNASNVSRMRVFAENIVAIVAEYIFEIVYILLLMYSGYLFFMNPTLLNGILFAAPFVVVIVKTFMKETAKRYGVVKTVSGNLVTGVQIGLFDPEFKTLLYTTYTNNLGEYSFIVENKEYLLKIMDEKYTLVHNNVQVEELMITKSEQDGIVRIVREKLFLRSVKI